ncbi:MAG: N-acetylmuramoyl-L-alanine amidase, partial [Holophaga sp.]|nr:N-acetylmuramoyl-L-alanine amidase [Holophaga sp.]
ASAKSASAKSASAKPASAKPASAPPVSAPPASPGPMSTATAQVQAALPAGGVCTIRLVFKQGVQVQAARLPKGFLAKGTTAQDWAGFQELSPEGKRWALHALFPKDTWSDEQVAHRVRWPKLESVWLMASLFMGHGQHYDRLQAVNPSNPDKLQTGDLWIIPKVLLSEDLGGETASQVKAGAPEEGLDDEARVAAYRAMLHFEQDRQGKYAAYHLRKGEALYSSVVMRYTDQVDPQGVNDLAMVIARRSGISDVRGIQPGQLVKIPVEALASPFQPEGTVALAEEREVRAEVRRTPRVLAGPRLKGVRIVLDAGHGGIDKGAMANGVWESDYVYDITMRVRQLLEEGTQATVSCTIVYPGLGFNARDRIPAPTDQAEILTTPPFANDGESPIAVSVHLRWVLANHLFADFERTGDPQKTLFISFHADSLHPSARGTMVYVPGAVGVPAAFALPGARTVRVRELVDGSRVRFTPRERLQGEARSRLFAESMLQALQAEGIPTHENRPIRNVVLRGGKSFIPAVIRYNTAATKVLMEVLNLTNREDAANLQDPVFREQYAQAVVKGIQAYYRN